MTNSPGHKYAVSVCSADCNIPVHHHGKVIRLPSSLLVFRNKVVPTVSTSGGYVIAVWDAAAKEWHCESNGAWGWCERNQAKENTVNRWGAV